MSIALMLALLAAAPAAEANGLSIAAGEAVIFRLDGERPVLVRSGETPEPGELAAKLRVEDGKTFLQMTNNTNQWLDYRATMTLSGGRKAHTSVCTLMSDGRGGIEFWPQRLKSVTIYEFRTAPENQMSCR
jgi:hypothetical protein